MPTRDAPMQWKMRVFFPKYVTINNKPLFVLYWLVTIVTVGIAVYQFIAGKRYEIQKLPEGEVSLCSQMCGTSWPTNGTTYASYCGSNFGEPYQGVQCPPTCSSVQGTTAALVGSGNPSCVNPGEAMQYSGSTLFMPTFFQEKISMNPTFTAGTCNTGFSAAYNGKVCTRSRNYFFPFVEQQSVEFSHTYIVPQPTSSIFGDQPDITGDSRTDTTTIVLDRDGKKKSTIAAGERIRFTVTELLELAGLHECCDGDVGGALNMDEGYTRSPGGVADMSSGANLPTPRLTGVSLTIDLSYTNEGACRLDLQHDSIWVDGTVACLSVRARRQWTQLEKKGYYGAGGANGQVQRTYSGLRIDFHIHGAFKFIDGSAFFRGMTTILIWMGIPIWILYFFAVFCLGKLSQIYSRVIHQELSLAGACVGLAGRLISHTSAFADVQDFPEGLSKKRLHERFQMIMQFSQDLDDLEVRKFVDFVYEGVAIAASESEIGTDNELIDVQDFCTVCSTNESITFDSLCLIFDRDRRLGCFESMFQDDVIDQARSVAANDNMADRVKNALVKTQGAGRNSSFARAGAFNAVMLEQRFQEVETEINKIQTEMTKTLLKEKNLTKQVEYAEKNVERLGGSLTYK